MNLIKSNLTGLLVMFAALCPNMTMAESADAVSFGYVEKELKITGDGRNEIYLIGLYSFDLPALREKLKSFYSNEQQYLVPHKLFIARHKREPKGRDWWFAVKYKLNEVAKCGYMEDTTNYIDGNNGMIPKIRNLRSEFLNGMELSQYRYNQTDDNPLAQSEEITALLENRFNVKKYGSGWPAGVAENSEYSSKEEIVTALFEGCNEGEFIALSDLRAELLELSASDTGESSASPSEKDDDDPSKNSSTESAQMSTILNELKEMKKEVQEKLDAINNKIESQSPKLKKTPEENLGGDGGLGTDPPKDSQGLLAWLSWTNALIVLLIIIIVATGYWLYRKVRRMNAHSNLGKINADEFKEQIVNAQMEQTQVWDKKLDYIDKRLINLTSLVNKGPSNEKPTDTRQQPKSPASPIVQEILINKKLDKIEQQLKNFASPFDQEAWLKRQTEIDEKLAELAHLVNKDEAAALLKAYTGHLERWLKQQIKQSIARGKIYNDKLEKLQSVTGDYGLPENGTYDECNSEYKRCYEHLSDSMQENRHATLPDRGISWMMGLLDEYFKSAHNLMLMLPRVTESGYQRELELTLEMERQQEEAATAREQQQKEADAAREEQQKEAEAEHERQEQRYQRLEDQIGDLKKTNVQIYRQGGLRVKENEERVSGRLAELGHLYTERGTVLQYARAIDALRKRLRESESTDASFFRAVKLDVLLERLNQFDEFHRFYEIDELSEFLIGHWQDYIQLIFRACLLLKSYFQLDPRHSILLDLNLARSAAAKLLDEHGLIPDDFELPAPSDRFERKFEVTVHGEIPADLVSHAGFKDKVQALRKSGVHKVACYVSRWGLSSQDEALKNNDLPRTCLKSLEKSDVVVQGWGG